MALVLGYVLHEWRQFSRGPHALMMLPTVLLGSIIFALYRALRLSGMPSWDYGFDIALQSWRTQGIWLALVMAVAPVMLAMWSKNKPHSGNKLIYFAYICLGILLMGIYYLAPILLPCIAAPFLIWHFSLYKLPLRKLTYEWVLWFSAWNMVVGLTLPVLLPLHRLAFLHLLFISGYLLMTLVVAAKVVASHAGYPERLLKDRGIMIALMILMFFAALSRLGVDWAPDSRLRHYGYAAICVLAAMALWLWRYGPLLFVMKKD